MSLANMFNEMDRIIETFGNQTNKFKKCKGANCEAVGGVGHSQECEKQHTAIYNMGLNTAGNRNPEARYAGYQDTPYHCKNNDEEEAYKQGQDARGR